MTLHVLHDPPLGLCRGLVKLDVKHADLSSRDGNTTPLGAAASQMFPGASPSNSCPENTTGTGSGPADSEDLPASASKARPSMGGYTSYDASQGACNGIHLPEGSVHGVP